MWRSASTNSAGATMGTFGTIAPHECEYQILRQQHGSSSWRHAIRKQTMSRRLWGSCTFDFMSESRYRRNWLNWLTYPSKTIVEIYYGPFSRLPERAFVGRDKEMEKALHATICLELVSLRMPRYLRTILQMRGKLDFGVALWYPKKVEKMEKL